MATVAQVVNFELSLDNHESCESVNKIIMYCTCGGFI